MAEDAEQDQQFQRVVGFLTEGEELSHRLPSSTSCKQIYSHYNNHVAVATL